MGTRLSMGMRLRIFTTLETGSADLMVSDKLCRHMMHDNSNASDRPFVYHITCTTNIECALSKKRLCSHIHLQTHSCKGLSFMIPGAHEINGDVCEEKAECVAYSCWLICKSCCFCHDFICSLHWEGNSAHKNTVIIC